MKAFLATIALSALAGCANAPVTAPPKIVTVTKVQYVPLPAADLLPCVATATTIVTNADLWVAYQQALTVIGVCNGQITDLKRISSHAQ